MREILFRGKRIDNGEWVEGYYAFIGTKNVIIKQQPEDYYSVDDKMKMRHGNEISEVDPETVCQYTGYSDINGKRIFEGDIVEFLDMTSTENGYYEMDCCGIVGYDKKEMCFFVTERLSAESWEVLGECAVSGNIFDNPDLIGTLYEKL